MQNSLKVQEKTLALFGAGKIGRSFIAQVFARNGYRVVFIDLDSRLVDAIQAQQQYTVQTLESNGSKSDYIVKNIAAINGGDRNACLELLDWVPVVATSVGAGAIPVLCELFAESSRRRASAGTAPFNYIIAENLPKSAQIVHAEFEKLLLPSEMRPGVIAASIGKTSPEVPSELSDKDPLLVYGDSYNTLTLSANGWVAAPLAFPEIQCVENIQAYIDRKLYIHNLAHCALAYFGYAQAPELEHIHEVLQVKQVYEAVQALVHTSGRALCAEYPEEFSAESMQAYTRGVFERISNPALQDTVWRVGRDLPRKLGRTERIVGSMLLAAKHGLDLSVYIGLYTAALAFTARNSQGNMAETDREFHENLSKQGLFYALYTVSALDNSIEIERNIAHSIQRTVGS